MRTRFDDFEKIVTELFHMVQEMRRTEALADRAARLRPSSKRSSDKGVNIIKLRIVKCGESGDDGSDEV